MAIVSMKKLTLVGYAGEKEKIIKALHKTCCVEIDRTAEIVNTEYIEDIAGRENVMGKLAKILFAFEFLKNSRREAEVLAKAELIEYEKPKKPLISQPSYVDYDVFCNMKEKGKELFATIEILENINVKKLDIKSEITKLSNLVNQLKIYENIDSKFSSFTDTKSTIMTLGTINTDKVALLEELRSAFNNVYIECDSTFKPSPTVVICLKTDKDAVMQKLSELDFAKCAFNYDFTAKEKIDSCNLSIKKLHNEELDLVKEAIALDIYESEYKLLYDYYTYEAQKVEAKGNLSCTKSSYVLEGWLPIDEEENVANAIKKVSTSVLIAFTDPTPEEKCPTLTRNNKLVGAYEIVTNMYSVPSPNEMDPNKFVSFFFFLFFGFMVSDAGYGLIMAVGAGLIYFLSKPAKGGGKMFIILMMGGISTFFWGVIFGGWFGMTWNPLVISGMSFAPMENPILVLGLSLGLGILHIMTGVAINAYSLIKSKHYQEALGLNISWLVAFLGLGIFVLSMFVPTLAFMETVGLVCILLGLALLLVFGGAGNKGIKRVIGGVPKLYGIINYLSDILSYSRLFALGLATGIIGMVFNEIAGVIMGMTGGGVFGSILGVVISAPVLIAGHTFNIGINTLGAYVHNCRLQYIEFFGKFYTGGGHIFMPLGSNMKYNHIKM